MKKQLTFYFYDNLFGIGRLNETPWEIKAKYFHSLEKHSENISTGMEDKSAEEILPRIDELEARGYGFLQSWSEGFNVPDRIIFPTGKIYDFKGLTERLNVIPSNALERKRNLGAIEFWSLVDSCAANGYRWGLPSFVNDLDARTARQKYQGRAA